jgi:hypothetical protein
MAMGRRAAGSRSTKQAAVAAAPRRKTQEVISRPVAVHLDRRRIARRERGRVDGYGLMAVP